MSVGPGVSEQRVGELIEFLESVGAADVEHTDVDLEHHLRGVYDILRRWGCGEALCLAGLFHSVYGTEKFRQTTIPLSERDRVRAAIGERAERLAYLYCAIVRSSLYYNLDHGAPYHVTSRYDGQGEPLTLDELSELFTLDLANRLEQLPRLRWSPERLEQERRTYERGAVLVPAAGLAEMREALGGGPSASMPARQLLWRARRLAGRAKAKLR